MEILFAPIIPFLKEMFNRLRDLGFKPQDLRHALKRALEEANLL